MNHIEIKNEKICQFYKNNSHINIEKINIIFIELLNNINLNKESLLYLDFENDKTNDLYTIFDTKLSNCISPILNKSLDNIDNKASIIKLYQEEYINKIKEMIDHFNNSIINDSQSIKKNDINEFIHNFEMKSSILFQNIQQPLYTFINGIEERITPTGKKNETKFL
jgi:hypothetical protein